MTERKYSNRDVQYDVVSRCRESWKRREDMSRGIEGLRKNRGGSSCVNSGELERNTMMNELEEGNTHTLTSMK